MVDHALPVGGQKAHWYTGGYSVCTACKDPLSYAPVYTDGDNLYISCYICKETVKIVDYWHPDWRVPGDA
jgi:hypothetical protein